MERIDLLWDAWEDCLCKEQLRAEFNKLTAENEMLSTKVATLQSQLDKISEPYSQARYNFDFEGIENSLHGRGYWYSVKSLRAIRAYLDSQKPSEKQPKFHDAIRSNIQGLKDYRGVWHEGGIEGCPICKPKCEHKNIGPLALGGTQRCLDCHEWIIAQPLTQCPECGGTRQKRVDYPINFDNVLALLSPTYRVYECCPRCRGEGVI